MIKWDIKIVGKFEYYLIILCLIVGCAQTKSDIINSNEEIKPFLTYTVQYSLSVKPWGNGNLVFVLDEHQINNKIFEILSKSNLFSLTTEKANPIVSKKSGGLKKEISDFHLSIKIGWDNATEMDEFLNSARAGIVSGSLGLFPVTVSDEILTDIYVTSPDINEKKYHYEKTTTQILWAPIHLIKAASAKNDGYKLIFRSKKFTSKVEKMMEEFIVDFSRDFISK